MNTTSSSLANGRAAPYGPISAVLITISSFFGSQLVAGILLSLVPVFTGWGGRDIDLWLRDSVAGQFASVALVEACVLALIGVYMYAARLHPRVIGMVRPQFKRDVVYAVGGYVCYFAIFIVVSIMAKALLPDLDVDQEQNIIFDRLTTGPALLLVFTSLVILPPVTEEVIVRGFLFSGLRKKLSFLSAGFVTSLLFGAAHLQWGTGKPLLWIAALDTFVLSLILVYLREKTHSLWPCILIHMFKNAFAFCLLFVFRIA